MNKKNDTTPVKPVENSAKTVENPVENFQAQIAELTNDLQRTRADFENFRKQTDLQKSQAVAAARQATVAGILPLLDQLQLALASYPDQLAPLAKTFDKTLADYGLKLITSATDTPFDPALHDAVMVEPGDGDKEVIAETLRPGYYYHDEVLRPAMVKVRRV